MYIVSECLLGVKCKYNGGDNLSPAVCEFLKDREYIKICPEVMGGLTTPRPPAEIQPDGRIINKEGRDVTAEFKKGADLALAKVYGALLRAADERTCVAELGSSGILRTLDGREVIAILKANSPTCGCSTIYDGTFSGKLIPGYGVTAELFRKNGIRLMTEKDFEGER